MGVARVDNGADVKAVDAIAVLANVLAEIVVTVKSDKVVAASATFPLFPPVVLCKRTRRPIGNTASASLGGVKGKLEEDEDEDVEEWRLFVDDAAVVVRVEGCVRFPAKKN